MEATASAGANQIISVIANGLVVLIILAGLAYFSRKNKALRLGLIIAGMCLGGIALLVVSIYGDMGKGFAL